MDEEGARRAAAAFWDNDPYYPRPGVFGGPERDLWLSFKRAYRVMASKLPEIALQCHQHLPGRFLDSVEEEGARRFPSGTGFQAPPRDTPKADTTIRLPDWEYREVNFDEWLEERWV